MAVKYLKEIVKTPEYKVRKNQDEKADGYKTKDPVAHLYTTWKLKVLGLSNMRMRDVISPQKHQSNNFSKRTQDTQLRYEILLDQCNRKVGVYLSFHFKLDRSANFP